MKTIYVTKQMPAKKRKTSLRCLVMRRHKELKQQVENYRKAGWTFTIEHRGIKQYLCRQKMIEGVHKHISMRAHSWKDLDDKLFFQAEQEIRGKCWAGYNLTPSELETIYWIMDYTIKRKRIEPSPLLERYRKQLGMGYDSRSRTSFINPDLPIRKRKNILKAARKVILRAANRAKNRIE